MRRFAAAITALAALLSPIAVTATASAAPSVAVVSKAQPPRLEFGDKGRAVAILQRALSVETRSGDYGFFSRRTERAVKAFQIRMGIRKSGVVGADTWAALGPAVSRAAARSVAPAAGLPWETFAARDLVGYRTSAYQGKYYDPRLEQFRLCVFQREAGGLYHLNSYYQGAYQFAPSWSSTIRAHLRPEMAARYGQAGANAVDDLARSSVSSWNRFWQDAAFYAVLAHSGAGPWAGGNWGCDSRPNRESGWPNSGYWNYMPFEG